MAKARHHLWVAQFLSTNILKPQNWKKARSPEQIMYKKQKISSQKGSS